MLEKAKGKLKYDLNTGKLVIDPRVAYQIVEHASIASNEVLQDMWAGLFASSCHEYEEDENILFIDILKRLTSSQVKLINNLCTRAEKKFNMGKLPEIKESGLIYASLVKLCHKDLFSIMETGSELKVETELNSLINIGLITHTQNTTPPVFFRQLKAGAAGGLIPTVMALRLYVKCQGSVETPFTYFLDEIVHDYYNQIKDVISVEKENILNFLYENHTIGQNYTDFLEFGINRAHPKTRHIYNEQAIVLKDETWLSLSDDELNNRLRPCIIYRYLSGIGNIYPVIFSNQHIGTFNYQEGIRRDFSNLKNSAVRVDTGA